MNVRLLVRDLAESQHSVNASKGSDDSSGAAQGAWGWKRNVRGQKAKAGLSQIVESSQRVGFIPDMPRSHQRLLHRDLLNKIESAEQ